MEKEAFFKSKAFGVFIGMLIVLGIINLVKAGYHFGQWLYAFLH